MLYPEMSIEYWGQAVIDLTAARDRSMEEYGRADRTTMTYQDRLDDAVRMLSEIRGEYAV